VNSVVNNTKKQVAMREIVVEKAELIEEVQKLAAEKVRLGSATCLDEGDHFEVIYHFEKDLEIINLRIKIGKGEPLPSISNILLGAVLNENEMMEMFGLDIIGMAIDFKNRMLLAKESQLTPLIRPQQEAK
jgi:NADH:ubiquinone oxidoreductase subunit C